jgi:hypothetical protein
MHCDKKGSVWNVCGQVVDHATQVLLLNNLVMFGFQNLYDMIGNVV